VLGCGVGIINKIDVVFCVGIEVCSNKHPESLRPYSTKKNTDSQILIAIKTYEEQYKGVLQQK
jgi:hypothetical protein